MKINGIIAALVTPYNEDKTVNYDVLKEMVEHHIAKGVNGFYVCGSTAECFLLSEDERKKILEVVVKTANGRVPVISHVGNIATHQAVALAEHAAKTGADAISSVTPFYYKFSLDEIAKYYESISKAADKPLIVYNFPAFSGVSLTADNLHTVLDASGAEGLKYTSYDLFELERIHRTYPKLSIFNGHDEVYANALPIGINGAIGSTFNVMPQKYHKILEAYDKGLRTEQLQAEVNDIIDVFIKCGVNQSIKYLLTKEGLPCGNCREPFSPLSDESKKKLDNIFEKVLL